MRKAIVVNYSAPPASRGAWSYASRWDACRIGFFSGRSCGTSRIALVWLHKISYILGDGCCAGVRARRPAREVSLTTPVVTAKNGYRSGYVVKGVSY